MRRTFSVLPTGPYGVLRLALDAAQLPTDDLARSDRLFFELADEASPIGFIGLECAGADRLLRSLVVPSRKRRGYGALLVAHAEAFVRQEGLERLHLLTEAVPDSSAQFASLCPASAAYLAKDIA